MTFYVTAIILKTGTCKYNSENKIRLIKLSQTAIVAIAAAATESRCFQTEAWGEGKTDNRLLQTFPFVCTEFPNIHMLSRSGYLYMNKYKFKCIPTGSSRQLRML